MKKLFVIMAIVVSGILSSFNVMAEADDGAMTGDMPGGLPEIYIKAVNPGYTINGENNVGEMIEIGRKNSDEMISLAGVTVRYTNSSGNEAVLVEFPENSYLAGESVLLRLASSSDHELANLTYAKTLAFKAGPLTLMRGEEVIDSVCWTGKDGCTAEFKSANPTVLIRNETGVTTHVAVSDYEVKYAPENYYEVPGEEEGGKGGDVISQCKGLVFSEILSFYETAQSEQFIEFYNAGAEQILLDGCMIRYKNKLYPLSGIVKAEGYFVRTLGDFNLTKNPTTANLLELVGTNGEVVARLEYPNGQRKGTAYAFVGYNAEGGEIWRVTYAPTPGEANNYQEFRTCEEGKVINETTGNCVKVTEVAEKTCAAGQYLNPLTGRCRKIPEPASETVCKDGYELNLDTGRCRKIKENTGADYALIQESYEEKSSFVAVIAVVIVLGVGLIYIVFEFRHEILKLIRKVFRRFH